MQESSSEPANVGVGGGGQPEHVVQLATLAEAPAASSAAESKKHKKKNKKKRDANAKLTKKKKGKTEEQKAASPHHVVPVSASNSKAGCIPAHSDDSRDGDAATDAPTTATLHQTAPLQQQSSASTEETKRRDGEDGEEFAAAPVSVVVQRHVQQRCAMEMWKLVLPRWRAAHTPSGCSDKAQRAALMAAANFLFVTVRFGAGVFLALTPYLEDYFWEEEPQQSTSSSGDGSYNNRSDDVTLVIVGGGPDIDYGTGIGLTDSMMSAMGSLCNMASGCVVTACVACGTLKGRLLFVGLVVSFVTLGPLVGLMLADTFWGFFGAIVCLGCCQGVMTSILVPVQLLIAPESKFLIQALSDLSL